MSNSINPLVKTYIDKSYTKLSEGEGSDKLHTKVILVKELKGICDHFCFWAPKILLIVTGIGLLAFLSETFRTEFKERKWVVILDVDKTSNKTHNVGTDILSNNNTQPPTTVSPNPNPEPTTSPTVAPITNPISSITKPAVTTPDIWGYFKNVNSSKLVTLAQPSKGRDKMAELPYPVGNLNFAQQYQDSKTSAKPELSADVIDAVRTAPPIIAHSNFVPPHMVEHLMRNKANGALSVKFEGIEKSKISNMEGALHTFVTPLCAIVSKGDFPKSTTGHKKGLIKDDSKARQQILSASIHPDFEYNNVMLPLIRLDDEAVIGQNLPDDFQILSQEDKQDKIKRVKYDAELRKHMIYHLTKDHRLPSIHEIETQKDKYKILPFEEDKEHSVIAYLEKLISTAKPENIKKEIKNCFVDYDGVYLSLEVLFNTYIHQIQNEFYALNAAAYQGFVYTVDPPKIFAAYFGNAKLLNRLQILAFKKLSTTVIFNKMRYIGYNTFSDPTSLECLKKVFANKAIPKSSLYDANHSYKVPPNCEGCALVIHNNSDAFGQNIQTEGLSSLDGVVGFYSNAFIPLLRSRPDLMDFRIRMIPDSLNVQDVGIFTDAELIPIEQEDTNISINIGIDNRKIKVEELATLQENAESKIKQLQKELYTALARDIKMTTAETTQHKLKKDSPWIAPIPNGLAIRLPQALIDKTFDVELIKLFGELPHKVNIVKSFNSEDKEFRKEFVIPGDQIIVFLKRINPKIVDSKNSEPFFLRMLGVDPLVIHHSVSSLDNKPRTANTISLTLAHLDPFLHQKLLEHTDNFANPETKLEVPLIEFNELGMLIKIPEKQEYLKNRIQSVFYLKSQFCDDIINERKYGYQFLVKREQIPNFLETLGLDKIPQTNVTVSRHTIHNTIALTYLEDLTAEIKGNVRYHVYTPVRKNDPLESINLSLSKLVYNDKNITPYAALHPRGWLSIRVPKNAPDFLKSLKAYLQCDSAPIQFKWGNIEYDQEIVIYEEGLPEFFEKTLKFETDFLEKLRSNSGSETYQVLYGTQNQGRELRVLNTICRSLATYDKETCKQLKPYDSHKDTRVEDLPDVFIPSVDTNLNGMLIMIPQQLQAKKIKIGENRELSYEEYLCHIYGVNGKAENNTKFSKDYTYTLFIPKARIENFLLKDLALRELPNQYKQEKRETYYNELLVNNWDTFLVSKPDHAGVNMHVRNALIPMPTNIPDILNQEILDRAKAILGDNSRAATYLQNIKETLKKAGENQGQNNQALFQNIVSYLRLLAQVWKDSHGISLDNKKMSIIEIGEGCGNGICMPGRLTKIQLEYQRLVQPSSGDHVKTILLDEVEQFKNNILIDLIARNAIKSVNGVIVSGTIPQGYEIHVFSWAQVKWTDYGLNREAGQLDDYVPNVEAHRTGWKLNALRDNFRNACEKMDEPKVPALLNKVYESISGKKDENGLLLNADAYQTRLRNILKKQGYKPAEIDMELDKLITETDGQITITKKAVKLMLIDVGALKP